MLARDIRGHARLIELFGSDARARLLYHLAWFARAGGSALRDGAWRIAFVPTHEQLGVLVGTAREHVTRLISELDAQGEIRHSGTQYEIPITSSLRIAMVQSEDEL